MTQISPSSSNESIRGTFEYFFTRTDFSICIVDTNYDVFIRPTVHQQRMAWLWNIFESASELISRVLSSPVLFFPPLFRGLLGDIVIISLVSYLLLALWDIEEGRFRTALLLLFSFPSMLFVLEVIYCYHPIILLFNL